MKQSAKELLHHCLFFAANSLARIVTKLAEEEFGRIGFSPSSAFILLLVIEQPGISQKELAAAMDLAQSTVSRFTDALISKGMVEKQVQGRTIFLAPTKSGLARAQLIQEAWKSFYRQYSKIIGQKNGDDLAALIDGSCEIFKKGK